MIPLAEHFVHGSDASIETYLWKSRAYANTALPPVYEIHNVERAHTHGTHLKPTFFEERSSSVARSVQASPGLLYQQQSLYFSVQACLRRRPRNQNDLTVRLPQKMSWSAYYENDLSG